MSALPVLQHALSTVGSSVPGLSSLARGSVGDTPAEWQSVADAVNPAIVDIETRLNSGIGAGTGMIISSDGRILTNFHVVDQALQIVVTEATTGVQHTAYLVGARPDQDVAVLQLKGVDGLATIPTGDPDSLSIGDPIAAIGNAGGVGGPPVVAPGSVIALDQSITATEQDGSGTEHLEGMIAVRADVQPGDSGGALVTAESKVVGMTTAASSSDTGQRYQTRSRGSYGFAIPIDDAMTLADEIVASATGSSPGGSSAGGSSAGGSGNSGGSGSAGGGSTTGQRAVLGVRLYGRSNAGVTIVGVNAGSPAEQLGLPVGGRIVAIDGETVTTPDDVLAILDLHEPGDQVDITWTDVSGARHRGSVALGAG